MELERRVRRLERTNRVLILLLIGGVAVAQRAASDSLALRGGAGSIEMKVDERSSRIRLSHRHSEWDLLLECGLMQGEHGGAQFCMVDPSTGKVKYPMSVGRDGRPDRRENALRYARDLHGKTKIWMTIRKSDPPNSVSDLEKPLRDGDETIYLRARLDPWGKPFEIRNQGGRRFQIVSAGPDGKTGTDDDIAYPEK
ncbi:MAG: type II secretion system protein GspG [Planctomycetota bacterium]|jgi:hypothetical protein